MRPVSAFFLVSVAIVAAQDLTTEVFNDKTNTIETKTSVRLDPYIRKALLKALSDLEESDERSTITDITDSASTVNSGLLGTNEDTTETFPSTKEKIQIHSFVVNGQAAFANNSNTTPTFVDSKISIISSTTGNVENQVTATLPTQAPFNDILQTKGSSVNIQQVRSIQSTQSTSKSNFDKSLTITKPAKTAITTTTTTTTTTTPRPTHNEDGENIEPVDQRDVQVFSAPLVAAFTVHQDAQGLPKKVIPLYQRTNFIPTKIPSSTPASSIELIQPQIPRQQPVVNNSQNDFIRQQLALQKQLEEKQRVLEEQLRLLQIQQRQQEELLRKQHFLLQQKEAQRQQQYFFEQEQLKRQQLEQQRQPSIQTNFQLPGLHKNVQQNKFLNQNNGAQNAQVSIQPSVPIVQGTTLTSQQQLPNREAVDFLLHLRNQQREQFPLQENHIPQGISSFLQPNPVPPFNQAQNFNQIRAEDQFRQKQANRVFRQEAGVGNFGVNNPQNFNRFNSFNPIIANRFFPANRPQFNPDIELKHLLVQNGLSARSQEDLNIVSKVLSLNHGIPLNNNVSNRLPFDNRRPFQPFL